LPDPPTGKGAGRPRKYGDRLGTTSSLALANRERARETTVNLYGRVRTVLAYSQVVMQKTLKCQIKVVWVYRRTRWVALFSTDLTLSVTEIIEYYGARWQIEAGFKELKRDIGSAETQTRNPVAVKNHLDFCLMATSLAWIYACRLEKTPRRRHAVKGRDHFAFSDVRRLVAQAALNDNFSIPCPVPRKSVVNSLVAALMQMAAWGFYGKLQIISNKMEYYRLLQQVRDKGDWERWVLYMLEGVETTAHQTIWLIQSIKKIMMEYKHRIRKELPKIYSQDLLNNLFRHPYTKIEYLQNDLRVSRLTATKYLQQLTVHGFLSKSKIGRYNYYINRQLMELFMDIPKE
jgi:hypothetical protein